jgi:hypothetical protein
MKDVRIDTTGQLRCWNCGSVGFKSKRTLRSKMLVGVGTLVTKKKLKCEACGEYNDTGGAKPYKGPASQRLGKKYGTLVNMHGASAPDRTVALDDEGEPIAPPVSTPAPPPPPPSTAPAPLAPGTPADWMPDPTGRFEHRYWDGARWTEHVVANDQQTTDQP